ncbi:MAG: hypothetical protein AB1489_21480 [Acidobacteriota bacterium]
MTTGIRVPKKKFPAAEATNVDQPVEPLLYLITEGTVDLWKMFTVRRGKLVELMLVFDSEKGAFRFIEEIQESHFRIGKVMLSKLKQVVEDRDIFFVLNPAVQIQGEWPFLKEGPEWGISIDVLAEKLMLPDK